MTGVDIVGALLRDSSALTAMVAASNIKARALPESAPLPSLLVRSAGENERQRLKRGVVVRYVERVAVTVRAANYRDQVAILKLARRICAGWTGSMAPAARIAILSAGTSPDMDGPNNTFEQTQDFRVSFDAPA